MIKENLQIVQQNIKKACERAKREENEVTLIAVSKTKPISAIEEAKECNILEFGENKVQELAEKEKIIKDVNWHMIGHLQRNKVKSIIDKVCLIHSVDSYALAQEIQKQAEKTNKVCPILIEVNIASEESKFGVPPNECEELIRKIAKLSFVSIKGLMTVAPFVKNPEENRIYFRNLRKLNIDIANKNIDNVSMKVLSMGMTNDYETAIEEGATMVRIGTGIFGERN